MGKTATATAWPMSSTSAMPAATTATPTAFLTNATLHREQVKIAKATKSPTIANWGPSGMRGTTARVMPQFGLKAPGWRLNSFTVQAGFETVTGIDLALFDGFSGRPASLCEWSDPDGDGIPLDAEPLIVHPVALRDGIIDLNENSLFDIPDTYVGPAGTSFFVGIVLDFEVTGSDFPARYDFNDQPPVPFVSWVIGATAPIDPSDLVANSVEFQLVEDAGLPPGNWVLQAVVGGSDCDGNGIPDDCDVANGAPDCNNNLLPDACELPTQDCNLNGLLDDCDILDGTSQDLDGDNILDECPLTFIDVPSRLPHSGGHAAAEQEPPSEWPTAPTLKTSICWAKPSRSPV